MTPQSMNFCIARIAEINMKLSTKLSQSEMEYLSSDILGIVETAVAHERAGTIQQILGDKTLKEIILHEQTEEF